MLIKSLSIEDIVLITPDIYRDERGFFSETFNLKRLKKNGISANFVQDNHSLSAQMGVVRGLHFQSLPHAQDKLVRVTRGSIFDVAVDIRKGSPTFGKHVAITLSADNWQQIWIPKGFAHGFCTLEPDTEVLYKVTDYYDPRCDRGLAWDDPELGIAWPVEITTAILSKKDRSQPPLSELPDFFSYGNNNNSQIAQA